MIWYLPIAATVANAIVFARFLATGLWQEVASAISIMWCVCAVAAIMMRKSQAEKDNYQFTLAADALIAGASCSRRASLDGKAPGCCCGPP